MSDTDLELTRDERVALAERREIRQERARARAATYLVGTAACGATGLGFCIGALNGAAIVGGMIAISITLAVGGLIGLVVKFG